MAVLPGSISAIRRLALCLALALACLGSTISSFAAGSSRNIAIVLRIDGAIGPASLSYIGDGLRRALDPKSR